MHFANSACALQRKSSPCPVKPKQAAVHFGQIRTVLEMRLLSPFLFLFLLSFFFLLFLFLFFVFVNGLVFVAFDFGM